MYHKAFMENGNKVWKRFVQIYRYLKAGEYINEIFMHCFFKYALSGKHLVYEPPPYIVSLFHPRPYYILLMPMYGFGFL